MKRNSLIILFFLGAVAVLAFGNLFPKGQEPWTPQQLLEPADLVKNLKDPKQKKPALLCVGPGGGIPGTIELGQAKDKENLDKLKAELQKLPKDAAIVLYCGCCPFDHCPNIRPAFNLMNEMKFTNHKLLNIRQNLKVDWINKGYPIGNTK